MASSKLVPLRGSGKFGRKSPCSIHAISIWLLLASCAVLFGLLCFTYINVKSFVYNNDKESHATSGATSLNNHMSEFEDTALLPARTPLPEITPESGFNEAKKEAVESPAGGPNNNTSAVIIVDDAHDDDSGLNNVTVVGSRVASRVGSRGGSRVGSHKGDEKSAPESAVLVIPGGTDNVGGTKGNDDDDDAAKKRKKRKKWFAGCDITQGWWVYDEAYPLYRSRNCPFVDPGFRCEENGRPDTDFMKYRWQPHDCDLPRFEARDMLEKLRGQRVVFVGDSLGRNQWESMLCMLAEGVRNKSRIYETSSQPISKHVGSLVFRFHDYNCTVEYYRDPFLVPQTRPPPHSPGNVTNVLKLDQVSWSVSKWWPGANIVVLNSGHWWSWEKIFRGGGRFQMGKNLTTHGVEEAFGIALKTWALWMEDNLDPETTQVFFRSYASVHFRGGSWNTGGHCHKEVKPLTDKEVQEMQPIPWTNKRIVDTIKQNIKTKRSAVEFMDITTSTNYRADGHGGLYNKDVKVHGPTPKNQQDCSHFCLPGVPDTWNEFLYATLLARGQGVWGEPSRY